MAAIVCYISDTKPWVLLTLDPSSAELSHSMCLHYKSSPLFLPLWCVFICFRVSRLYPECCVCVHKMMCVSAGQKGSICSAKAHKHRHGLLRDCLDWRNGKINVFKEAGTLYRQGRCLPGAQNVCVYLSVLSLKWQLLFLAIRCRFAVNPPWTLLFFSFLHFHPSSNLAGGNSSAPHTFPLFFFS